MTVTNEFVHNVEYIPTIDYLYCLACFQRTNNRQNKSGKSDLPGKEEKASLLGWEAGWSECCSANVPRVKPTYRVIGLSIERKGGTENPKTLDRFAIPEDRPCIVDAINYSHNLVEYLALSSSYFKPCTNLSLGK